MAVNFLKDGLYLLQRIHLSVSPFKFILKNQFVFQYYEVIFECRNIHYSLKQTIARKIVQ